MIIKNTIELFKSSGIHFSAYEITKFLRNFTSNYSSAGDFWEFKFDAENDYFLIEKEQIQEEISDQYLLGELDREFNKQGGYWVYFKPKSAETPASPAEDQSANPWDSFPNSFPPENETESDPQTQMPDIQWTSSGTRAFWKESDILGLTELS